MNLYIKVINGICVDHPAFEDNLLDAFQGNIPPEWEPFVRVEKPTFTKVFQVISEEPTYQKVNNVWTDVWDVRDMTIEEQNSKTQQIAIELTAYQQNRVNFIQERISTFTDANAIAAWQDCLTKTQNWTYTINNDDPINWATPDLPDLPKLVDGVWV
jgi:hypothetical protein